MTEQEQIVFEQLKTIKTLQGIVSSLAERVVRQSELLSRRAERTICVLCEKVPTEEDTSLLFDCQECYDMGMVSDGEDDEGVAILIPCPNCSASLPKYEPEPRTNHIYIDGSCHICKGTGTIYGHKEDGSYGPETCSCQSTARVLLNEPSPGKDHAMFGFDARGYEGLEPGEYP